MKTAITTGYSDGSPLGVVVDEHPSEVASRLQNAHENGYVSLRLTHADSGQSIYFDVDAFICWHVVEKVEFEETFPEREDEF